MLIAEMYMLPVIRQCMCPVPPLTSLVSPNYWDTIPAALPLANMALIGLNVAVLFFILGFAAFKYIRKFSLHLDTQLSRHRVRTMTPSPYYLPIFNSPT